jgi:hypothetical protein
MNPGISGYGGGAVTGVVLGVLAVYVPWRTDLLPHTGTWLTLNLGHSVWLFGIVLICYCANLLRLQRMLEHDAVFKQVVQLDQLSDVWIHVFVGIGVVWTAIGMRSALATTLNTPGALTDGAGEILTRLVDGGILLALTTTIVGAIGGYLMRLGKTMLLGAQLTGYYHQEERSESRLALDRLRRIESHLEQLVAADCGDT